MTLTSLLFGNDEFLLRSPQVRAAIPMPVTDHAPTPENADAAAVRAPRRGSEHGGATGLEGSRAAT